jgi:hypothetical protein
MGTYEIWRIGNLSLHANMCKSRRFYGEVNVIGFFYNDLERAVLILFPS